VLLVNGCSFTFGDELEGCYELPMTHWHLTWADQLAGKLGLDYDNIANCGSGNEKIFRDTVDYLVKHSKTRNVTNVMVLWSDPLRKETMLEIKDRDVDAAEVFPHISMTQWHERRQNDVTLSMSKELSLIHCNDAIYNYHNTFGRQARTITAIRSAFATGYTHLLSNMVALQALCDGMGITIMQGVFHSHIRSEYMKISTRVKNAGQRTSKQVHQWRDWTSESLNLLRQENRIGLGDYDMTLKEFQEPRDWYPGGHPDEQAHTEFAEYLYYICGKIKKDDQS
jgi:hypothetical protein|tara:strand:+ start:1425 stop:2270 length:846 start_codon:yes stop_codon:yes gene_type:complete